MSDVHYMTIEMGNLCGQPSSEPGGGRASSVLSQVTCPACRAKAEFDAVVRAICDTGALSMQLQRSNAPAKLAGAALRAVEDSTARAVEERTLAIWRDVRSLAVEYGDPSRDIIAAVPFGASLEQLMIEDYGMTTEPPEVPGE